MAPRGVVVVLACSLLLTACGDGGGADPDLDATPGQTVDGRWRITRQTPQQPAECRELHASDLTVVFTVGAAVPIVIEDGGRLFESSGYSVTATTAHFVSEDYAFPSETTRPVLISHDLTWLNSVLVGTGGAQGDGDDLGCTWSLELHGTRLP